MVKAIFLVLFSLMFSNAVHAKDLDCRKTDGNGKGWLPDFFSLDVSSDRKSVKVTRGKKQTFGNPDFKKSFLGSDFWSRGTGTSTMNEVYHYQVQLILKNNDQNYQLKMVQAGYRDLVVSGKCTEKTENPSKNNQNKTDSSAVKRNVTGWSDKVLCDNRYRWSRADYRKAIKQEIKLRGLDCNTVLKPSKETDSQAGPAGRKSRDFYMGVCAGFGVKEGTPAMESCIKSKPDPTGS